MKKNMSDYTPDRWVVVKITAPNVLLYKVFACWYGGYAGSDSWKMNSGITKVTFNLENYCYYFEGYSGSVYGCYKDSYGTNSYGGSVLNRFIEEAAKTGESTIEILPENTNFLEINYDC
jgi:hypothetical protein